MRRDLPWPELRAHIASRLIPLQAWDPITRTTRSDYDLNPGSRPKPGAVLHPASVLVAIVEHPERPTVILTRRSDELKRHAGQVAFPGGRSEPGETPWQTALREAHEEVGLDPERVTLAGMSSGYETVTGFLIAPVVGFVAPGFTLAPDPREVAEVFEVPLDFLMETQSYEERFFEQSGNRRYFYAAPYEDRLIWGATAGMLRALRERLFGEARARREASA